MRKFRVVVWISPEAKTAGELVLSRLPASTYSVELAEDSVPFHSAAEAHCAVVVGGPPPQFGVGKPPLAGIPVLWVSHRTAAPLDGARSSEYFAALPVEGIAGGLERLLCAGAISELFARCNKAVRVTRILDGQEALRTCLVHLFEGTATSSTKGLAQTAHRSQDWLLKQWSDMTARQRKPTPTLGEVLRAIRFLGALEVHLRDLDRPLGSPAYRTQPSLATFRSYLRRYTNKDLAQLTIESVTRAIVYLEDRAFAWLLEE